MWLETPVSWLVFATLTQPWVLWEDRTPTEELPWSDWPSARSAKDCLDCWWGGWRCSIPRLVGVSWIRKEADLEPEWEPSSACLTGLCINSCLDFPLWQVVTWKHKPKWTLSAPSCFWPWRLSPQQKADQSNQWPRFHRAQSRGERTAIRHLSDIAKCRMIFRQTR